MIVKIGEAPEAAIVVSVVSPPLTAIVVSELDDLESEPPHAARARDAVMMPARAAERSPSMRDAGRVEVVEATGNPVAGRGGGEPQVIAG